MRGFAHAAVIAIAALAVPAAADSQPPPTGAAGVAPPSAQAGAVAWMVGAWEVEAKAANDSRARGTSVARSLYDGMWIEVRDTYPDGSQRVGYLGYDDASEKWQSISVDARGTAIVTLADRWDGDHIVFEGDAGASGLPVRRRQIVTRVSAREYRVSNQQWVDGAWRPVDDYRYVRPAR